MGQKITKRPNQPIVFEFTHPGDEHGKLSRIDKGLFFKEWNLVELLGEGVTHRRKYICQKGQYIDRNNSTVDCKLEFWGEWEPDSFAESITYKKEDEDGNSNKLPKYHHFPFLLRADYPYNTFKSGLAEKVRDIKNKQHERIIEEDRRLQNTDPFVYGNHFMYSSICKPEQVLDLQPGSIILFGSCKEYPSDTNPDVKSQKYRVDTVFVIKDVIDLTDAVINSYKNTIYYDVALRFIDMKDGILHKIFIGATPDDRIDGMYSFIPAHKMGDTGFGTMFIDNSIDEFKNVTYTQSKGKVVVNSTSEVSVKCFWQKLLEYTYDNGYLPATKIEEPPVFYTIDELADWWENGKQK